MLSNIGLWLMAIGAAIAICVALVVYVNYTIAKAERGTDA